MSLADTFDSTDEVTNPDPRADTLGRPNPVQQSHQITQFDSFTNMMEPMSQFSQDIPDFTNDYYFREPIEAPAHLGNPILNSVPSAALGNTSSILPAPASAVLGHMHFAESKGDDVVVLASSQRFREKFITTVYYKSVEKRRKAELKVTERIEQKVEEKDEEEVSMFGKFFRVITGNK